MSNNNLDFALTYARKGLSVFPVMPDGKRPLGRLVTNGVKDATTDEQKIRDWWRPVPSANVAIATGTVFAVDLDVGEEKNGIETWKQRTKGKPVPETTAVMTPSGGVHLYFRAPEDVKIKNSVSGLGEGVDVRGHGGYVIAPPSSLESGKYSFRSDTKGIASAPDWLLSEVKKSSDEPEPSGEPVDTPNTIHEGERNDTLFRIGCSLRERPGMSEGELRPTLHRVNDARCTPPLPRGEVNDIVDSITGQYPQGERIPEYGGDGQAGASPPSASSVGAHQKESDNQAPEVHPLLGTEEPPPMKWRVADFVPEDHLTMLLGDGGTGKSILSLYLALCICIGRSFLGMGVRRGNVLYVDHELDRNEQLRRIHRIARGMGIDAADTDLQGRLQYWRPKHALGTDAHQEAILEAVETHDIDLVILDSLTMGAVGDVTDVSDVVPIMQHIRRWPTTIAIDHVSHDTAKRSAAQARAFGSVFKRNAARSSLTLAQSDTGGYCIQQEKSNFSEGDGRLVYAVEWTEDEITFETISDADKRAAGLLSDLSSKDVTLVAVKDMWEASNQPVMPSDVVTWREEHDTKEIGEGTVRNHFTALKNREEMSTDKHGGAIPSSAQHEGPSDPPDDPPF